MLHLETLSVLDKAFPCCPSGTLNHTGLGPAAIYWLLFTDWQACLKPLRGKVSGYRGLPSPLRIELSREGWGQEEEREEPEPEEQPEEEQPFTLRCSSSDWLRVSAASLEQKVKVDCSVNVEAADKYPCLQLEVERQRQLQQVVCSADPAHRAWLEDIGGPRADSHTRMACEIMPLRR